MSNSKIVKQYDYKGMQITVKHIQLIDRERAIALEFGKQYVDGHHCGYVTNPLPLTERQITQVDVHGGITYGCGFEGAADGMTTFTYGFDCAHWGDTIEAWNADAVASECEFLANQIRALHGIKD